MFFGGGVELFCQQAERIGIVGLSGNGKTTLVNLLQRAYDIQGGQILLNGKDIRNFTQKSLHQIGSRTVIAVSHRLSTLKEMDRIIVLAKGRIVEQGTIKELLAQEGIFYCLWCAQQ